MEKLINFLDLAGIDAKMYWRVPSVSTREEFEIEWRKDAVKNWRFRKVESLLWTPCSSKELKEELDLAGVNLGNFERQLHQAILQQVAYANKIVTDARRLFGHEAVDYAIDDNERFLEQLKVAIEQLTMKKPALTTIQGDKGEDDKTPVVKPRRLSLVDKHAKISGLDRLL